LGEMVIYIGVFSIGIGNMGSYSYEAQEVHGFKDTLPLYS
jgi:hypothetical protein